MSIKSRSLYFDLAYAQEYGILYDVLNRYTIVPEPDVNYYLDGVENGSFFAQTPLSLLLKSTNSMLALQCAQTLIPKGARLDAMVSIPSEMHSIVHIRGTLEEEKKQLLLRPLALYACSLHDNPISSLIVKSADKARLLEMSKEVPLLARAVKSNNLPLIQYLLEEVGVDPNGQLSPKTYKEQLSLDLRREGTAVDLAFYPMFLPLSYVSSKEALSLLLMHGAKMGQVDVHCKKTPFDFISARKLEPTAQKEILEMCALSLEKESGSKRSDLKKKNTQSPQDLMDSLGEALFCAIESKNKLSINSLIKSLGWKNIIHFKNTKGQNLLVPALESQNFPLVKLLLSKGLSVNTYDKEGKSVLTRALAAESGSTYLRASRYDPKGVHRKAFREKFLLPLADLSALDHLNRPLFWQLWGKKWDLKGLEGDTEKTSWMESICKNYPKYPGSQEKPDPLVKDSSGKTFIEYVLEQKNEENWDTLSMLNKWCVLSLFESTLSHPNFDEQIAHKILNILLTLKNPKDSFNHRDAALVTGYSRDYTERDDALVAVFSKLFTLAPAPSSLMNIDSDTFRNYPKLRALIDSKQLDQAMREAKEFSAVAEAPSKTVTTRRL